MRYELNVATGEVIEREPTAEELAQEALDQAKAEAKRDEAEAAEAAKVAARESARAKLAALGLTEQEVETLLGGN